MPEILHLILQQPYKNLYAIQKQSKWFLDIVVKQRIGQEEFLKKLFQQGKKCALPLLATYSELSAPLSRHLLGQLDRTEIVDAAQRLEFLRYEPMTSAVFDQFLSLFKQISSNVDQRMKTYPLLLQCAVLTSVEQVSKVLEWITKRFVNEQLIVVEHFLEHFENYDDRFHLTIVPKNLKAIEDLTNLALNHLQHTSNTIESIVGYAILLLKRAEYHRVEDTKIQLREFACKIIKQ
jgi:hypothetical protein